LPPHARLGLVTTADLLAAGLTSGAITKRVARGALRRWYIGVYSYGPGELSREAEWMAAVLAAGDGAVLSHRSAAALWEIRRDRRMISEVLAPRGRRPKGPVLARSYRCLDPRDVTVVRGIPVTTVARTLVDLADVLTAHQLVKVIDEADYLGLFDLIETYEAMQRANGRRNLSVLNRAIGLYIGGSAGTKSRNEDAFLALLRLARLPEPLVNVVIEGEEVDCVWPDRSLVVEVDGPGHRRPTARRTDARKARALTTAGYTVARDTDVELSARGGDVIARLRQLLA
jgi:very-short-patch-repair endonuclease